MYNVVYYLLISFVVHQLHPIIVLSDADLLHTTPTDSILNVMNVIIVGYYDGSSELVLVL